MGCQNSPTGLDLGFYAARWYSLTKAAEDWAALDPLLGEVGDGFAGPERAAAMGLSVVVSAYSARTTTDGVN